MFAATRAAGLARLASFIPKAADAHYARRRNFDMGPDDRSNVSLLSPYISHRLVGEWEVVTAVVEAHGYAGAGKFIDEVFWRTYWKGWLQHRPVVWDQYRAATDNPVGFDLKPALSKAWDGTTGIACFDAWVQELKEQGYLHNHARMWFASIWIFTLKLPWYLGAEFFLRHLIDADAASNTLSWRWVAGLHTQGKTYLAHESNIAKFTEGRFPVTPGLAAEALTSAYATIEPNDLAQPCDQVMQGRVGVLVTDMDLAPLVLGASDNVHAVGGLALRGQLTRTEPASPARSFAEAALENSLVRMGSHFDAQTDLPMRQLEDIIAWAGRHRLDSVVTADLPVGPGASELTQLNQSLGKSGVTLVRQVRPWDQVCWPHCKKGFFALRKAIPTILDTLE
ncbi:MAG: FAD-binding domain-containing protein [Lysobacterales bacterium]